MPFITGMSLAALGNVIADAGTGETVQDAASYLQTAIAGVQFQQVVEVIVGVAPTILPLIVTVLAFRKGLNWVLRLVRKA